MTYKYLYKSISNKISGLLSYSVLDYMK